MPNAPTVMPNSTDLSPPKIAVKFANMVFVLGVMFSLLITAYAAYRIFAPISAIYLDDGFVAFLKGEKEWINPVRNFYVTFISAGIISAILFGLGLRIKDHVKVNLSLLLITTSLSVYAAESYLEFSGISTEQSTIELGNAELASLIGMALKTSSKFTSDQRTTLDVIRGFWKEGVNAYPVLSPHVFVKDIATKDGLRTKGGKTIPLGSISKAMLVGGNENGYFMTYVSDRYGFHNPDDVYDTDMIDIVMTGDSFTEGASVRSDENIRAVLSNFGLNVVSLGQSGNGPLLEYAVLREYAHILRPRIVLWLYYRNDIHKDLRYELLSDLLIQYLYRKNFSQNLISRQKEIDKILIDFVEKKTAEQIEIVKRKQAQKDGYDRLQQSQLEIKHRRKFASKPLIKILKLRNLRKIANLVPEPNAETSSELPYFESEQQVNYRKASFKQILESANELTASWNGRMYFIYLPSGRAAVIREEDNPLREFVLNSVAQLDIPIIDIQEEVFSSHPDPYSLYPYRHPGAHFNAKGYRAVAEAIAERLKADGVLQ